MEMTKLKCSGYFKTQPGTDKDSVTFNDFVIILPHCKEEYYQQHVKRMFPVFLEEHKTLKKHRYEGLIRIYMDDCEIIEGTPRCFGKDIKEMKWDELQSLACYFNIMEIRLHRSGSLRAAQENAYMCYQRDVLKKKVFKYEAQVLKFEDEERQKGMRLMLDDIEIRERIENIKSNAFMMITYPNDPQRSYNFSKLPPVVIEGEIE